MRWRGVSVDGGGKVTLADLNGGVSVIPPGGVITQLVSSQQFPPANWGTAGTNFYLLGGTALDSLGNLYAVDLNGGTILKITPAGVVSTVAGGTGNTNGLQLGALPGRLPDIRCAVVGPDGSLFVTARSAVLQIRF
jgi:hypothetical protein